MPVNMRRLGVTLLAAVTVLAGLCFPGHPGNCF